MDLSFFFSCVLRLYTFLVKIILKEIFLNIFFKYLCALHWKISKGNKFPHFFKESSCKCFCRNSHRDTFGFGSSVIATSLCAASVLMIATFSVLKDTCQTRSGPQNSMSCKGTLQNTSKATGEWGSCSSHAGKVRKRAVMKVQLCGLWKGHFEPKFPWALPVPECCTPTSCWMANGWRGAWSEVLHCAVVSVWDFFPFVCIQVS